MRRLLLLATFAVTAAGAVAGERQGPVGFLDRVIPSGAYRADVFTMGMPQELAGIQATFARSVAEKQSWFQDYVAKLHLKPGESLPYTAEMGIKEAEYAKLTNAYQHPTVMPLATTDISIVVEKGTTHFLSRSPYDFLKKVSVSPSGKLTAEEVDCSPSPVTSRKAKFGVWSGQTWFYESGDTAKGDARTFEFSIGKLDDSQRPFIVFADTWVKNKKTVASAQFMAWLVRGSDASKK